MSVYFHKDIGTGDNPPFLVYRRKDSLGNYYTVRRNKTPRGMAYKRLNAIEYRAHHKARRQSGIEYMVSVREELKSPS